MDPRQLPTQRLGRVARLAALGARAGAGKLRALVGPADAAEQRIAEAMASTLGELRGLAMKVGQVASYVDGFVPEAHRELYEQTLRQLRSTAPTMSPEEAARVVEEELGAPPHSLFAHWDPSPFAAASIGQVHHAHLEDGRHVAVKVQQLGVRDAVTADLDNMGMLGVMVPLAGRMGVKEQLVELRARFLEELDYVGEADHGERFHDAFLGHAKVRIPRVHRSHSSARVLTCDFVAGLDFEEACQAPPALRLAWAETLWTFVFESILIHGLFNADPHPGNYRFAPDGGVYFLDFGCVKQLSDASRRAVCANHQLAVEGNLPALRSSMLDMLGLPTDGPMGNILGDYVELALTPITTNGPFHLTRPYAASLVTGLRDRKVELLREDFRRFRAPQAEWLFFNRLQLGFYSLLARLDVPVDYRSLQEGILRRATAIAAP